MLLGSLWSILLNIFSFFSEPGSLSLVQRNEVREDTLLGYSLLPDAHFCHSSKLCRCGVARWRLQQDQVHGSSARHCSRARSAWVFQRALPVKPSTVFPDLGPLCLMLRDTALRLQHRKSSSLCTFDSRNCGIGQDLPSMHLGNEQLQGGLALILSSVISPSLCPVSFFFLAQWIHNRGYKLSVFFFQRRPPATALNLLSLI